MAACLRREKGRQGNDLAFLFTCFSSRQMDFQWFMAARKIGKRVEPLEPPTLSELSNDTHEVICGVAGCVVKKKKFRRITE